MMIDSHTLCVGKSVSRNPDILSVSVSVVVTVIEQNETLSVLDSYKQIITNWRLVENWEKNEA